MLSGASEPTLAQPLNKIAAVARAAACGVQHLALDDIFTLQVFQPLSCAARAFGCAAEIEQKQDDREHYQGDTYRAPGPRPCEDAGEQAAPHQRRPFRQSSTRA